VEHCDECGFTYSEHDETVVARELGELGELYSSRLRLGDDPLARDVLRRRPDATTWSAIEYGCHLRDVLLAQRERLYLALVSERPSFVSIFRDERAVLARYDEQEPDQVAREIAVAAEMISWAVSGLDEAQWSRLCVYNFPEASERNVRWLAQHTLHEGVHHLYDIDRVVAQNRRARTES
jgi:hypothetical protein